MDIPEALLQYAWQTQQFAVRELRTTDGRPVQVVHPGRWNTDGGPDFRDARLKLGDNELVGDVELHRTSREWYLHGHQANPAYNKVVLHVVLEAGQTPIQRADTRLVPEAVVRGLVEPRLLERSQVFANAHVAIPCGNLLETVADYPRRRWLHSLGLSRLVRKAEALEADLQATNGDWNQAFWQALCSAIGAPQNREPFYRLAQVLPIRILERSAHEPMLLEAGLFGAAGFLDGEPLDDYMAQLQQHWAFLRSKFDLTPLHEPNWQFLRMRPANFPTVRLAQIAALIHHLQTNGTGSLIALVDQPAKQLDQLMSVETSSYWRTHYRLGTESKAQVKRLGADVRMRLLVNLIIPFGILYHKARGEADAAAAQAQRLTEVKPETNTVVQTFADLGLKAHNALESQAMLDLKRDFCDQRRCLACGIGHELLKPGNR